MEVRKQGSIMQVAVAGIVVAAIILIAGAFWVGKSASEDTEKAVRNMSLLYLNELAERREQVVAARLADYISDLDVAVGLIGKFVVVGGQKCQKEQIILFLVVNHSVRERNLGHVAHVHLGD
jgi:hypothetical protein